jgi:hypothetical protein
VFRLHFRPGQESIAKPIVLEIIETAIYNDICLKKDEGRP